MKDMICEYNEAGKQVPSRSMPTFICAFIVLLLISVLIIKWLPLQIIVTPTIVRWLKSFPSVFCIELPIFIILRIVHEVMHKLGYILCGVKSRDIEIKWIPPRCQCNKIVNIRTRRVVDLLPLLPTVVIPLIVTIVFKNGTSFFISYGMFVLASRDIVDYFNTMKYDNNILIKDLDQQAGFAVIDKRVTDIYYKEHDDII